SSRRRHTRCLSDWSSDVCSSDLDAGGRAELRLPPGVYRYAASLGGGAERGVVAVETYSDEWRPAVPILVPQSGTPGVRLTSVARSEERRVGKGCGSRAVEDDHE